MYLLPANQRNQREVRKMNKERELLRKILRDAQYLLDQVARLTAENAMLKEKWLAQPEQEPVAWMDRTYGNLHEVNYGDSMPLYASPPKREPLSDEAVCEILLKKEWKGFVDLVRIIEKAHGIGVDDE